LEAKLQSSIKKMDAVVAKLASIDQQLESLHAQRADTKSVGDALELEIQRLETELADIKGGAVEMHQQQVSAVAALREAERVLQQGWGDIAALVQGLSAVTAGFAESPTQAADDAMGVADAQPLGEGGHLEHGGVGMASAAEFERMAAFVRGQGAADSSYQAYVRSRRREGERRAEPFRPVGLAPAGVLAAVGVQSAAVTSGEGRPVPETDDSHL
jgi:hypothetical protein